jgi:hypothetical protein
MQNLEKREKKQRQLVILYSIIFFGCPAIVTIITSVLQLVEENISEDYSHARYDQFEPINSASSSVVARLS